MNAMFLRHISQFVGILLLQLLLLNHLHVLGYICPVVLAWLTLGFARNSSRIALLLWSFAIGFCYDVFSNTMGIGMATTTLCGMMQPWLLNQFVPRDAADDMTPSIRSMTFHRYIFYVLTTMFVFHAAFYSLDAFMLRNWRLTLMAVVIGTAVGTFVVMLAESFLTKSRGYSNS